MMPQIPPSAIWKNLCFFVNCRRCKELSAKKSSESSDGVLGYIAIFSDGNVPKALFIIVHGPGCSVLINHDENYMLPLLSWTDIRMHTHSLSISISIYLSFPLTFSFSLSNFFQCSVPYHKRPF